MSVAEKSVLESHVQRHLVKDSRSLDELFASHKNLSAYFRAPAIIGGMSPNREFVRLTAEVNSPTTTVVGHKVVKTPTMFLKGDGSPGKCIVASRGGPMEGLRSSPKDGLMRVFFAEKIRQASSELGLVVSKKEFYPLPGTEEKRTYVVVCEKLSVTEAEDTYAEFRNLSKKTQKDIIRRICQLVERHGFADAHFGNIRFILNAKGEVEKSLFGRVKLAVIDTEPFGVKIIDDVAEENSFDKCVWFGLQNVLRKCCCQDAELETVVNEFIARCPYGHAKA